MSWRHSCGKIRHVSKAKAKAALRAAIQRMPAEHAKGMNCYRCTFCDGWHIGHARRRRSA